MEPEYDVAIIGGGPAGSTAAALLAARGRKVAVFEKEKFPRFHIGESLLPYSMSVFERLGVREKLDQMAVRKIGGEIASACGSRNVRFRFRCGFRLKHTESYQVARADFDKLLLDNAAEKGAAVFEETSVEKAEFGKEGIVLSVQPKDGPARTVPVKYVIDCSGRNALVGSQLKLRQPYPFLQKFSVFAHYENVPVRDGEELNLTRLIRGRDYWFWMIAISPERTSVGVVTDSAAFRKLKKSPEEALEHFIDNCPDMVERMRGARRVSKIHSVSDYSYRNRRFAGDRWLLAGDAAGFIDPVFSTGVFIALFSGERAADAVDEALSQPGRQAALFRRYEKRLHRIMDIYIRFVRAWYRPEFIEVFTNPVEHLNLAGAVNSALAGNTGGSFAIWWRMEIFYFILFLQRHMPLVPRLAQPA